MSEPTLSQLLDRAVHHAPPMDLRSEELLTAGRTRVRRRRTTAAGGVLGGAALVAAVWAGLGGDGSRELSATGEQTDDRLRARMLDEALEVLAKAWTGEPVHHRGEHYVVDILAGWAVAILDLDFGQLNGTQQFGKFANQTGIDTHLLMLVRH